jgi:hypothetical protein
VPTLAARELSFAAPSAQPNLCTGLSRSESLPLYRSIINRDYKACEYATGHLYAGLRDPCPLQSRGALHKQVNTYSCPHAEFLRQATLSQRIRQFMVFRNTSAKAGRLATID